MKQPVLEEATGIAVTPMHVNIPYNNCIYNCLPEEEPMGFKTKMSKLKN